MKQTLLTTLLLFVLSTLAPSQDTSKPPGTQENRPAAAEAANLSKAEKDLMQIERDWAAAMVKRDNAAIERITSSEYTVTTPDGRLQTRAEFQADLTSGAMKLDSSEVSDLKVRVFGDVAIVTGITTDKGQYKGQDMSGKYRFTDVFLRRSGRWQAVSTHVSRIAQ